ncbi:MAG TPA: ABC transporter substrate-binding protein [Rhodospirillales bacterium]|nr:ABC transporter substrate-binding protein [Rhodospirillales bacterium]
MKKRHGILVIYVILLVLLFPAPGFSDGIGQGAERFIVSLADRAITSLTGEGVTPEKRMQRFRSLLIEHFAVKTIGRWVLGRHWRKATQGEREEYLNLFEDLLVVTYAERFAKYSGETLVISKSVVVGGKDIVVYSSLNRAEGLKPLKVNWRVRARGGNFKIIDIIVEGISMGQTQRSEFASVILQNSGQVESLLSQLRKRLENDA